MLVDDEVVDELPLYLEQEFLPGIANDIDDPLVRMRLLSVTQLLGHLRARLGIGTEVDALNLDTVAAALGERFESWPQAERGIDELLRSGRSTTKSCCRCSPVSDSNAHASGQPGALGE